MWRASVVACVVLAQGVAATRRNAAAIRPAYAPGALGASRRSGPMHMLSPQGLIEEAIRLQQEQINDELTSRAEEHYLANEKSVPLSSNNVMEQVGDQSGLWTDFLATGGLAKTDPSQLLMAPPLPLSNGEKAPPPANGEMDPDEFQSDLWTDLLGTGELAKNDASRLSTAPRLSNGRGAPTLSNGRKAPPPSNGKKAPPLPTGEQLLLKKMPPLSNGMKAPPRSNGMKAAPVSNGKKATQLSNGQRAPPASNGMRVTPTSSGEETPKLLNGQMAPRLSNGKQKPSSEVSWKSEAFLVGAATTRAPRELSGDEAPHLSQRQKAPPLSSGKQQPESKVAWRSESFQDSAATGRAARELSGDEAPQLSNGQKAPHLPSGKQQPESQVAWSSESFQDTAAPRRSRASWKHGMSHNGIVDAARSGVPSWRNSGGFQHAPLGPDDAREKNAQVVIMREGPSGELFVLLQRRSMNMHYMPGFLGAIGGRRDDEDRNSRDTAIREVFGKTGLLDVLLLEDVPHELRRTDEEVAAGIPARLPQLFEKFAEGHMVDWWVLLLDGSGSFEKASKQHKVDDVVPWLPLLPVESEASQAFGHAWVPVAKLYEINKDLERFNGLQGKILDAQTAVRRRHRLPWRAG